MPKDSDCFHYAFTCVRGTALPAHPQSEFSVT